MVRKVHLSFLKIKDFQFSQISQLKMGYFPPPEECQIFDLTGWSKKNIRKNTHQFKKQKLWQKK